MINPEQEVPTIIVFPVANDEMVRNGMLWILILDAMRGKGE
jgi:hypothetical protein